MATIVKKALEICKTKESRECDEFIALHNLYMRLIPAIKVYPEKIVDDCMKKWSGPCSELADLVASFKEAGGVNPGLGTLAAQFNLYDMKQVYNWSRETLNEVSEEVSQVFSSGHYMNQEPFEPEIINIILNEKAADAVI